MIKLIISILFLLLLPAGYAQEWETSLDAAKTRSEQEKKSIVLVFSGSDWCIPCMKLEKYILESREFIDYSREHFIMLRADFPKKKANALPRELQIQNDKLAEVYNRQGMFPLVVMLDAKGKVLGTESYRNVSPAEYIALLHSFEKHQQ